MQIYIFLVVLLLSYQCCRGRYLMDYFGTSYQKNHNVFQGNKQGYLSNGSERWYLAFKILSRGGKMGIHWQVVTRTLFMDDILTTEVRYSQWYYYYCWCYCCCYHCWFVVVVVFVVDVRGSVHHSTIHTEKSNKMLYFIKIYYSVFIRSSTCFGQHTAHH